MSRVYLQSVIWEFILALVASVSLSYTLLNAFYVDPSLQYTPIPAVVSLVCLAALYLVGARKSRMVVGGVIYGVVLAVVWLASAALAPSDALTVDSEQNYLIFAMVTTVVPTFCYLLSRNRVSAAFLFIIGGFLIGLVQFFYGRFEIVWAVLFVFSALSLLIYKNYQLALRSATSVEKLSFLPGFLVAAASSVVAVGLGALVWFAIIAPLGPGALEVKLITEYRALETIQVKGTSSETQTPNLDTTSSTTNGDIRTTDDAKEEEGGELIPAKGEGATNPDNGQSDGVYMGLDWDSLTDAFDMQSNPQNWPLYLIFIIPIILIVGYFVLRRSWRVKRLNDMRELGPEGEFEQMFLFLVGRLERLGIRVPKGQTMSEFAISTKTALHYFNEESQVEFGDLANSYATMVYGIRPVSDEDVERIERFYNGFWKAARKQLGNVKYFFKSFRL